MSFPKPDLPERNLIFNLSAIGDVVQFFPMVETLQSQFS